MKKPQARPSKAESRVRQNRFGSELVMRIAVSCSSCMQATTWIQACNLHRRHFFRALSGNSCA